MTEAILRVEELSCGFHTEGGYQRVVDRVSFAVAPGETLGLVGESGSGKTVGAFAVMGLLPRPAGRIGAAGCLRRPRSPVARRSSQARAISRPRIAMIFQDPMMALNPVYTVGRQIEEAIHLHRSVARAGRASAASSCCARSVSPPRAPASTSIHTTSRAACGSG